MPDRFDEDKESAKEKLMEYYGSAMSTFPMAVIDLAKAENMTEEEAEEMCEKLGIG